MIRYYLFVFIVIILDQVSKLIVINKMEVHESIPIIDSFFYITSHRNRGAAWGILQDQMIFFYVITLIVVIILVYYLQQYGKKHGSLALGLSLILGGALGNFIDRFFRKEVVDFLDFKLFTYDYPIFNIADSALVIGVAIVIIYTLLEDRKVKTSEK